jgi:hypothetical protein
MAGSGLTQAKQSILKLMEGLFESCVVAEKDVTCFFFQSSCEVVRFADDPNLLWSNGAIKNYFDGVYSYGGNYLRSFYVFLYIKSLTCSLLI